MTEEETKTMRILALETRLEKSEKDRVNAAAHADEMLDIYLKESGKLQSQLAEMKHQRDALLEMTWLDLPSEPQESITEWRKLFEAGWERKKTPEPTPSKSEVLYRLFQSGENADKARNMSNPELAESIRRALGDKIPMHELAYDLIEEAASRLEPIVK